MTAVSRTTLPALTLPLLIPTGVFAALLGAAAVGDVYKRQVLHRIPRRAVTGVQLLRTPLLWAAGCTVLLVRSPGLQLVLPGIPAIKISAIGNKIFFV